MNATHQEVLVRCGQCGTACAPWLASCRKCGAPLLQQRGQPDWTDGQANRDLLDTLDAMGGAGSDLADPEVFRMLDEIESLTRDRLRARELLEGNGQAQDLPEPRLGPSSKNLQKALLEEFSETADILSQVPAGIAAGLAGATAGALGDSQATATRQAGKAQGPATAPAAPSSTVASAPATPVPPASADDRMTAALRQSSVPLAARSEPLRPSLESLADAHAAAGTANGLPPVRPAAAAPAPVAVDSPGTPAADGSPAANRKRKADPEDFLPPGFFDPRDRPPPRRWGRWVALGLLIAAMLLVAGMLIRKNHNLSRGAQPPSIGDLTRPAK